MAASLLRCLVLSLLLLWLLWLLLLLSLSLLLLLSLSLRLSLSLLLLLLLFLLLLLLLLLYSSLLCILLLMFKGVESEFFLHVVVVFGSFWDWFGRAKIGLKLDPPFRAQIATKYKTRLSIF